MNLVILDGYTLNPGDLSWDTLHELGKCTIYERTAPRNVISRACDAELVLIVLIGLTHTAPTSGRFA
jgi:glycerate dehydrogenase